MASDEEGEAAQAPTKVRYCAVYDCLNNHKTHPDITYFGFPSNKEKAKLWAEKIRRPDIVQKDGRVSSYYRVCETHFLRRDINVNSRRRRLMKRAVPARRLPHPGSYDSVYEPPTELQVKGKTLVRSTMETFQYVDDTPRQTRKRKKVEGPQPPRAASLALPALEGFFADCDSKLPQNTAEFVKLVARLQTVQSSLDDCLKLLHSSPRAYRLLRSSLGLPTVRTLYQHCAPRLPDLDTALDVLKTRIKQMTDIEKHCTLSVEIIDTRPNLYYNITFDRIVGLHEVNGVQSPRAATRVVVIAAKGLLASWTQPVALCYLARDDGELNPWIDKIICRLYSIGLKVHALVCDPAAPPPARDGVSPDEPFFNLQDTKIYIIYDPPRLMKMLLCDFMAFDFHFEKTVARWSDVLEYRKIERSKPLTLTPGLTDACLDPVAVRRMRPTRAARILSHSLAAALTSRADQGLLGESARATVNCILKINNLYNLLSSTTKKGSVFKKALSQDPSQVGFLTYMKSFFKSLKLHDKFGLDAAITKNLSDSWQITIVAVLALRDKIQPLRPYLLTRHLHLDDGVFESLQREVRGTPSCRQIFVGFKKQFLHDMLQPLSNERNVNLNALLARVTGDAVGTRSMEEDQEIQVQASDYRNLKLPKLQSLVAVAEHLLQAALRVHGDCDLAASYMRAPPEGDFLQLVRDLEEALTSALSEGTSARSLLRDLLLDVHVLDCSLPCECFPLDYLKRLFFRLRLYRILRDNQKRFKSGKVDLKIITLEE